MKVRRTIEEDCELRADMDEQLREWTRDEEALLAMEAVDSRRAAGAD